MGAADKFSTVEAAMAASHQLQTVTELRAATGLPEQEVRDQIKALARQGQIEHIPGRGRYDGRYGLLRSIETAPANVSDSVSDSEGGETDVSAAPEPQYDPRSVSFNANARLEAAQEDVAALLNIIADIRAAIGDKTGKIMLGDLAEHIRAIYDLGEAHKRACIQWETMMMAAIGEDGVGSVAEAIEKLKSELAASRQAAVTISPGLHPDTADLVIRFAGAMAQKLFEAQEKRGYTNGWLVDDDWSDECREQLVKHVEKGDPRDVANFAAFLWHHGERTALVGGVIDTLRDEIRYSNNAISEYLAELATERQAREALQEQLDAVPSVIGAAGYLVRAPKRRPRIVTKQETAVAAALAAARNGSGRGDVFALVPIGAARRGAIWTDTH